jgi:hypothetical protein
MHGAEIGTPKQRLEYIFSETGRGNGQPFLDALADDADTELMRSVLGEPPPHR